MHKNKDGKIVASLTEVKNKTGDIFSLVDEFGEVTLTSYNKPKYRIVKVGIEEVLNITEKAEKEKSKPSQHNKEKENTNINDNKVKANKPAKNSSNEVNSVADLLPLEIITKFKNLRKWDVAGRKEKRYLTLIKKPLQ